MSSEVHQLCSQRHNLGTQLICAPQRGVHILASHPRQLRTGKRVTARRRQQRGDRRAALMEQLGVDALLPGTALLHQRAIQPAQGANLHHLRRRDPQLGEPALHQQRPQQPRIGAVGLGSLLGAPQPRDLGRIPQMRHHPRHGQLLDHIPPPGTALQRELRVPARAVLTQPTPQHLAGCRPDLTPVHHTVVVHVIKRDLLPVHVKPAYHRHQWDLLKLPKTLTDAHINERLS
ncbi:hypothetical protein LAUMK4_00623 [Mycobacterium persicum]|uniref:Uncharacterized protein n=1 Tax=Mycobacterium persicum TaxID=1487726 RepID=A0ABY6RCV5_9MYCO|nr:hypothetical protein LAUMK15_00514 [Mycobacterium persicum]VAZ88215.1 hypothetical protein LAUMK4_00623 [Mycobacterium persicum]